jgi:hypothetical protein
MNWQQELATGPNILKERLDKMEESKTERAARLNRERVQRHRDKRRESMVKVEVWIEPDQRERLSNYVKMLDSCRVIVKS